MGPQRTEQAWSLASASGARHRRFMVPSVKRYRRARSILPYGTMLTALQPCLKRTPTLLWLSREERA